MSAHHDVANQLGNLNTLFFGTAEGQPKYAYTVLCPLKVSTVTIHLTCHPLMPGALGQLGYSSIYCSRSWIHKGPSALPTLHSFFIFILCAHHATATRI